MWDVLRCYSKCVFWVTSLVYISSMLDSENQIVFSWSFSQSVYSLILIEILSVCLAAVQTIPGALFYPMYNCPLCSLLKMYSKDNSVCALMCIFFVITHDVWNLTKSFPHAFFFWILCGPLFLFFYFSSSGIPNMLNVVSNFPFMVIGLIGLVFCYRGNYFKLRYTTILCYMNKLFFSLYTFYNMFLLWCWWLTNVCNKACKVSFGAGHFFTLVWLL